VTHWQPSQFRQIGRFPSNRARIVGLGVLTTQIAYLTTVRLWLRPGTVANITHHLSSPSYLGTFKVAIQHHSMAVDVSCASLIDEPITGWSIWLSGYAIVLDQCGQSWSIQCFNWGFGLSVGSLGRIAMWLTWVHLWDMPSPLAMNVLLLNSHSPVSLIISLIPLWIFAPFTTFATLLCKELRFRSKPILSLDCSLLFDEHDDNVIGHGSHHGIFVHHKLQDDFPLIVPLDPAKIVKDVLLLSWLGDCLCSVQICRISISGQWHYVEQVILGLWIDLR